MAPTRVNYYTSGSVGMPPQEVADIVTAVADALDYAHDNGLLHRDVKPSNVLLTQPLTGRQRILLADFGISRWMADTSGLTQTNMAVGTVFYAAPQQLTDEPVDGRTDQYARAVTAYELLTGSPPFENSNPALVVGQHLRTQVPSLAGRGLGRLDAVMRTAPAKEAKMRFARCGNFAEALAAQIAAADGAADPTAATQSAMPPPEPPWLPDEVVSQIVRDVVKPVAVEMVRRGCPFSGLLYAGLAITSRGPAVVEFNCRFGDPETQSVLALLDTPLGQLLRAAATGQLADQPQLRWRDGYAVTVVVAAENYPGRPRVGDVIVGAEADGAREVPDRRLHQIAQHTSELTTDHGPR